MVAIKIPNFIIASPDKAFQTIGTAYEQSAIGSTGYSPGLRSLTKPLFCNAVLPKFFSQFGTPKTKDALCEPAPSPVFT
jgi:hypothetical protein